MDKKKKRPLWKRILGISLFIISIILIITIVYTSGLFGYWVMTEIFPFM